MNKGWTLKPPAKPKADSMLPLKRPPPSPDAGKREKLLRVQLEEIRNEVKHLKQSTGGNCHWPPQTQPPPPMWIHNQNQNGSQPWCQPPQYMQGPVCNPVSGYGMMPSLHGWWNNGAPGQFSNNAFEQCHNGSNALWNNVGPGPWNMPSIGQYNNGGSNVQWNNGGNGPWNNGGVGPWMQGGPNNGNGGPNHG
jgi:hypothetical protein